ncbi:hypothetical protein SPRG_18852 [Saprolegnia parasitica CBS 223.65]|uniref:Uncharacterized protein n=1 Tax=Saprolegnia parasitica (strain CBS 223.65) TaxID=695850 RepID=A0A067DAS4_SAPPC|nr:hypothetical protein SPRG_18852 [Saprolegnia parasitica CBS 223.65]KDO35696.1 hypothetical protein SPRG_18852 [Saprolegnia parasitica CBS 223.65]|eukprot:XP_012194068.1 hypothetical protein SPRG_18852 [Saprolegnia parasitica CBS 223.65]
MPEPCWASEEGFVLALVHAGLLSEDTGPLVKNVVLHAWLENLCSSDDDVERTIDSLSTRGWLQPSSVSTQAAVEERSYLIRMSPSEASTRHAHHGTSAPDTAMPHEVKKKAFRTCFPTVSAKAEKMYLKLTDPHVLVYATLGLNLISRGDSSVPAYSREMKIMGVDAQTRTIVANLLAKAFAAHDKAQLHQRLG